MKVHKMGPLIPEVRWTICGGTFLHGVDYAWKMTRKWSGVTCRLCLRRAPKKGKG